MRAAAVVVEKPERLSVRDVTLATPGADDAVVDVLWSGISTGTERLMWTGRMPDFPGMGYPLVPGYESVGRIAQAPKESDLAPGDLVFVPGSRGFADVRGLFGGAAARVVTPVSRLVPLAESIGEAGVLLALAATAYRAANSGRAMSGEIPDLVVGHGVLGRLIARCIIAEGHPPPTVWETNARRRAGATGYPVVAPEADSRRDYAAICDVSGDPGILDTLIGRLRPGGEIVLAGFYAAPLNFQFPPAFMREARLRVSAEWRQGDLAAVRGLLASGALSFDGLITHRRSADEAGQAYETAFGDPECLKMILDWREHA